MTNDQFAEWDAGKGPAPAWFPTPELIERSNIAPVLSMLKLASAAELHRWSVEHRAEFWELMRRRLSIRLQRPYDQVVDLSAGVELPEWLPGAQMNIVDSCFGAADDAPAIVAGRESGELRIWSYAELRSLTARVAAGLRQAGFRPGDSVAIDMPMTAESVAVYLGIVAAGCAVVSIADSFAPDEIAARLRIAGASGIFTQDYIQRGGRRLPLFEKVEAADAPQAVVLPTAHRVALRLRAGDVTWRQFLSAAPATRALRGNELATASCRPGDTTNILFSSGTTGDPKAIPWTHTTPIKAAADGHLHHDIRPGDVVAWPTNLGWMMGPWLIYASLINRATIALYEGAPGTRGFGEFVSRAGVTMLGVVPSLVKVWRETASMEGFDWTRIRAFSSTGECSNPDDMLYLMWLAGYRPVIEYCGGTEIGGGYITGTVVQPCVPSSFSLPAFGLDLVLLDEQGRPCDNGEAFLIGPSMGLSTRLLNRDHHEAYFADVPLGPHGEHLRRHGDQIERLSGGYYRAHGRVDDTMNLGGIKASCAEIERVLNMAPGISETAAIAVPPPGGGPSLLVVYVVPASGTPPGTGDLKRELQGALKKRINPLFKIHDIVVIERLPRTASNKVMRRELRRQYGRGGGA